MLTSLAINNQDLTSSTQLTGVTPSHPVYLIENTWDA